MGEHSGLKLLLSRDTTIPRWLRQAMRHDAGIHWGHARMKGRAVRCLIIPRAQARIIHGGSIELLIPGETAFRNGLYVDAVLGIQDLRGKTMMVNLLLCKKCLLPTGVRAAESTEIRCQSCGNIWEECDVTGGPPRSRT